MTPRPAGSWARPTRSCASSSARRCCSGFDSLDYWNQTYNRRAVENEIKKLDADGKRKLAEELMAQVDKASSAAPA